MAAQSNHPVVSLTDVFKTYKVGEVDVPAVKGVTFSIPRRRFSVIVGPSGSGKSTLLYLIGSLDEPTSGDIIVDGRSLSKVSTAQRDKYRRDDVGFIFQNFNLLSNLTAVENALVVVAPGNTSMTRFTVPAVAVVSVLIHANTSVMSTEGSFRAPPA